MQLRFPKIISIAIILILILNQATVAYALYSPTLNNEVTIIKQHLQQSKKVNGYGTWQQLYDKDQQNSNLNEGLNNLFLTSLGQLLNQSLINSFTDGLSLLFGRWYGTGVWISNCLRDDIWELQALQEQVLNELLKASLLSDSVNSGILWADYQHLRERIEGNPDNLNIKNLKNNFKEGKEWFPNSQNFYVDCPYGEFTKAWADLARAFKGLQSFRTGPEVGSFGSMAAAAQKRAIKRGQQWIKANQISLTIGGTEGANPRDITTGAGLNGLSANIKTEMTYAGSYADLIFRNTWNALITTGKGAPTAVGVAAKAVGRGILSVADYLTGFQAAYDAKNLALNQMEAAIKFNLSLQDVGEQGLTEIDDILENTNNTIKSATETKVEPETLITFCKKLLTIPKTQCVNKGAAAGLNCDNTFKK